MYMHDVTMHRHSEICKWMDVYVARSLKAGVIMYTEYKISRIKEWLIFPWIEPECNTLVMFLNSSLSKWFRNIKCSSHMGTKHFKHSCCHLVLQLFNSKIYFSFTKNGSTLTGPRDTWAPTILSQDPNNFKVLHGVHAYRL